MDSVRFSGFPRGCHLVCWYHEFQRNPQDRYLPQVNVALRSHKDMEFALSSQDDYSSQTFFQEFPVGVTYLGHLRIGSVIKSDGIEGILDGRPAFSHQERFAVDFTRGSWDFGDGSIFENLLSDFPWYYDISLLKGCCPRGPMLVFPLKNRCSLWIPCTEFFSRCYGRSQEIKRILSLYPWRKAKRRLFGSVKMSEYEGFSGWTIRLKRPFIPDDAVFLAHVWHDRYTEGRAKSIYAQLESGIPSVPHSLPWKSFVKVCPWFEGPAELLVRGLWFDDERDRKFLALRVDGCSDPEGVPVGYVHGGTRDSSSGAAAEGNRVRYVTKGKIPDEVRLTDRVEPDRGSRTIRVEDPPLRGSR